MNMQANLKHGKEKKLLLNRTKIVCRCRGDDVYYVCTDRNC